MKIVRDPSGEYPDCIVSHYGLEELSDDSTEEVLFYGYATALNHELREKYKDYKRRVYINFEIPCSFLNIHRHDEYGNTLKQMSYFTEVYSICPYTTIWMNAHPDVSTKFYTIPFPFPADKFKKYETTTPEQKVNDICYYGHLHSSDYINALDVVKDFNYRFISLASYPGLLTDHNVTSEQKWDILNGSKSSLIFNLLYVREEQQEIVRSHHLWEHHPAFKLLQYKVLPQLKTRCFEAAAAKTVQLVFRDPWMLAERWFEADTEFVYWEDFDDLRAKIQDISTNYEKYVPMVERAYEKVQNYSMDKVFEKIKNGAYGEEAND